MLPSPPSPSRARRLLRTSAVLLTAVGLLLPAQVGTAAAAPSADPAVVLPVLSCAQVARLDLQVPGFPVAIASATTTTAATGAYEVCDVRGTIAPQIQFQVQLPTTTWRQRYLQTGCGGLCGNVSINAQQAVGCVPLGRGDMVLASDDQGHVGGNGLFGTDPQLRVDFAHRADHGLALVAKQMIREFYGRPTRWSYWDGCSQGGHQGLTEAQRYPQDFDGILAGAPAHITTELNSFYQPWLGTIEFDDAGAPILTADKLAPLHASVMAECDGKDGLVDGIIDDPRACDHDPGDLLCPPGTDQPTCLTAAQVDVVRKIYSGPVTPQGERLYLGGEAPGSELAWLGWIVPAAPGAGSIAQSIGLPWLRYLALEQPQPGLRLEDWAFTRKNFERVQRLAGLYDATRTDLSAFRDRGGKLVMYHGWADQAISPYGTPAWYRALADRMGGEERTKEFARLFMVPGMFHCRGGDAPNTFDALTPVIDWVEKGIAPWRIVATQTTDTGTRTRPLFAYPAVARYDGSGSPDVASNFRWSRPPVRYQDRVDWLGSFPTGT